MYSAKALVVSGLMAVGKWFTFLGISLWANASIELSHASSPQRPAEITEPTARPLVQPRFFHYEAARFLNQIRPPSFGLFQRLSSAQVDKYQEAVIHALVAAENGETVRWMMGDAFGAVVPVLTWPTGNGYCRRVHIMVHAFDRQRIQSETACLDSVHSQWQWIAL